MEADFMLAQRLQKEEEEVVARRVGTGEVE
jgi:hypothetical protein